MTGSRSTAPRFYQLSRDQERPAWQFGEPRDPDGAVIAGGTFVQEQPLEDLRDVHRQRGYRPGPYMLNLYSSARSESEKLRTLIADSTIPITEPGPSVSINWHGFVVVTSEVAGMIHRLDPRAIQRFPIGVAGTTDSFEVLVPLRGVDCVDEERSSDVQRWTDADGLFEKVGHIKRLRDLRIHADRIPGDVHMCFTSRWIATIVSQRLKDVLEENGVTGAALTPV